MHSFLDFKVNFRESVIYTINKKQAKSTIAMLIIPSRKDTNIPGISAIKHTGRQ
jgi:hypothetical protein